MNDNDSSIQQQMRSISHGAVATIGGHALQRLIGVVMNGLLTRVLGPTLYSIYAVSWRLVWTFRRLVILGAGATMVRGGARASTRDERSKLAAIAYLSALIGGGLFASLMFQYAPLLNDYLLQEHELIKALRVFALMIPFAGVIVVNAAFLRSQHHIGRLIALKSVGWPLVRVVAIAAAASFGYGLFGIMGAVLTGTAVLALVGWVYTLYCTETRLTSPGWSAVVSFVNHALPNAMTILSGFLRIRIYIFLVGYFIARQAAAGEYNVALILMEVTAIPLMAFGKLFPPVASELYENGRFSDLRRVYTAVVRMVIITTLPLIIYEAIYGQILLGLFGQQYRSVYGVLLLFLFARLLSNSVGSTGWLLLMTDHQYPRLVLDWILVVVNLPLAYFLITEYGIIGAAIGNIVQIIGQNLLQLAMLYYLEGLIPFDWSLLKPLGPTIVMVAIMGVLFVTPLGLYRLVAGGLIGLFGYIMTFRYVGLESLDRAVLLGLYEGYREKIGL